MTELDKVLQLARMEGGEPAAKTASHGSGMTDATRGPAGDPLDSVTGERQEQAAGGSPVPTPEQWDGLKINELQTTVRELSDYIQSIRRELRVGIQKETGVPLCIVHNSATRRMIRHIIAEPEAIALTRLKAE